MTPELNPAAIYEFAYKETSHALSFFMPYDLEISLPNDVVIDLGRFSLGMLARIHVIPPYSGGATLRIGAFCEAAKGATILIGGNHANHSLLNYSFGLHAEYYQPFMKPEDRALGMAGAKPIVISDNVILSRGSTVLGGSTIGAGCVIGAGAVVTGLCEPLGIYAGVPARLLRHRFDSQMRSIYEQMDIANICAHSVAKLPILSYQLEAGAVTIKGFKAALEYLPARPKVHVSGFVRDGGVAFDSVNSFSVGGKDVTDAAAIEKLKEYFKQPTTKPTRVKWSPDIFYALGLYGPGST